MKRFIALLMAIVLTLTLFTGCSGKNFSFDEGNGDNGGSGSSTGQYLTRIEWAEMLGRYFGMEECIGKDPYFSDVSASHASFAYVQSGVEWGIFNKEEKAFKPNEYATVKFVVESAVLASESVKDTTTDLFEYARKQGIVEGDASSYVTSKYASSVIVWARNAYSNREFKEYENIVAKDTLVELKDVPCADNGKVTLNAARNDLKVGDVIITAPTPTNPNGIARKITKISTDASGKQVFETTEPELGDIYDELEFAEVSTAGDVSTILTEDGVKVVNVAPAAATAVKPQKGILGINSQKIKAQETAKGKDLSFNITLGSDGEIAVSKQFGAIEKEISQKPLSEEEKKIAKETFDKFGYLPPMEGDEKTSTKKTEKYDTDSGWKVTGTLSLENFYVETELKTKKFLGVPYGIETFSNEVHYKVTNSLSFKGYVKKKIPIATIPIALGATGLSIDVEIFLELSANGEIKISHTIENTSTVKYTDGSGFKKTQETQSSDSLEISVSFEGGIGASATLKAFGIKIINFELTASVELTASAKLSTALRYEGVLYKYDGSLSMVQGVKTESFFCIEAEACLPKIALSIGTEPSTLAYKLGIKLTWNIMDKKNATFKCKTASLHWEPGKGLLDECSLDTMEVLTEDIIDAMTGNKDPGTTEPTEPEEEIPDHNIHSSVFSLSHSMVALSVGDVVEISVTSLPQGYTGRDIRWQSDNVAVAIVDEVRATDTGASCVIKATGAGATCITVTTADKSKELMCAVTVKEDGSIQFDPLKDLPL